MLKEPQELPKGPYLLPRFNPGQGGVDFLGLRQVNLDLMAEDVPGINNTTSRIRPYSVMCWIYWKFYRLMQERGIAMPSEADMVRFKEKVESLFLWGHKLEGVNGVPGVTSEPTQFRAGQANLSFKSWDRKARNTSLQAAVQYGPSLSDRGGLGFLHQVERKLYQVTKRGEALAEALDDRLRRRKSYAFLTDLSQMYGSAGQAKELFAAWRVDEAGAAEREIFRRTFFNESAIGQSGDVGRRSMVIALIREILRKSRRALDLGEIRKCMAYGRLIDGKRFALDAIQQTVAKRWVLLQIRQAQRLAFESLLAWVEYRLLEHGDRDAKKLANIAVSNLRRDEASVFNHDTPDKILAGWLGPLKSFDAYVAASFKDPKQFCMFPLQRELEGIVRESPDQICGPAFKLLLLCRQFVVWFGDDDDVRRELPRGGAGRISLEYWAKTWDKNCHYPLVDLVALVLNNMILSQHFAVATNRFDGGTQRLRITIEEEGLEALVSEPWQPYVAADRLWTLLSLMTECELAEWDDEKEGYLYRA